ncbi:MAG: flap endonuclease [Acidimicrobiia bacterium]|nr:flap endonuclease [Acidimicrobiia bacterium]
MKVHLLDGTFELFRAYYGRRDSMVDASGMDVTAAVGVLDTTLSLLAEDGVTHVAASFDTVIESFRNEMFAGYKSSAGMPEDLLIQFPIVEDLLEAAGIVVWRNIEFEADDALAAAALRWMGDVEQVVICSPDKDLCQCVVGDQVVTYDRMRRVIRNEDAVREKFGIAPESIPDYLGLVGDTADGVPGLPGWGAKSASTVLARWGRIEMIPPDPDLWEVKVRSAAKLAATLNEMAEEAALYRALTILRRDVPIAEELEDLHWKGFPNQGDRDSVLAAFGIT